MDNLLAIILNFSGLAAFVGMLITLYIALKRTSAQVNGDIANASKDRADTLQILQRLVDEKAAELKAKQDTYTNEIASLRSDLAEVKRLSQAPFRITLEGSTYPSPKILKAEIEVLSAMKTAIVNQS